MKRHAGIKGLELLQKENILAVAVSHASAEIASAADIYAHGAVSHANRLAAQAGIKPGMHVAEAIDILRSYLKPQES